MLAAAGKATDAIACYEKALAIDARNVVAWCGKGSAFAVAGRHAEAISCFERVLKLDPRNASALLGKAISEEIEKRWREAANSYRMFIECAGPLYATEIAAAKKQLSELARYETPQNDETADRLNNEGLILRQQGRLDEALICYDEALEIAPRRAEVWCNKGNALHAQERYQEALQCFDKAVGLDPSDMKLWCNRGVALKAMGRPGDAVASYDKALQIAPRDVKTWFNKANALAAQEKYREALVCFQEAHNLGDPNAAKYFEQCRRLMQTDEDRGGVGAASETDYDLAQEWFAKAVDFAGEGKHAEAATCYEKGLKLQPGNAAAWFNMGHCMGTSGDTQT